MFCRAVLHSNAYIGTISRRSPPHRLVLQFWSIVNPNCILGTSPTVQKAKPLCPTPPTATPR